MLILVLAANTAYADFPRLASILARDRYLPRQLMNQGDRLAFSNGIIGLSIFAAHSARRLRRRHACADPALHDRRVRVVHAVAGRHGRPLAALRGAGWKTSAAINGFGALVTGIVLIVVAITKAHEGAWIILLLIPVHVAASSARPGDTTTRWRGSCRSKGWRQRDAATAQHRARADQRRAPRGRPGARVREDAVVRRPRGLREHRSAALTEQLRGEWEHWGEGVPLVVLESPYRSLMEPLLEYIEQIDAERPERLPHDRAAGVRAGALVAPSLPQPARAAHQRRAALQAEHRRHERAVSFAAVNGQLPCHTSNDVMGP